MSEARMWQSMHHLQGSVIPRPPEPYLSGFSVPSRWHGRPGASLRAHICLDADAFFENRGILSIWHQHITRCPFMSQSANMAGDICSTWERFGCNVSEAVCPMPEALPSESALQALPSYMPHREDEAVILTCPNWSADLPCYVVNWLRTLSGARQEQELGWWHCLSQEQFRVLRMRETEEIHSGRLLQCFEQGTYFCSACSQPLYLACHKCQSNHGWPAFSDAITGALDRKGGTHKVEITCRGCGGHLGHVFKSSRYPGPHHERHCVNSVSLRFAPDAEA